MDARPLELVVADLAAAVADLQSQINRGFRPVAAAVDRDCYAVVGETLVIDAPADINVFLPRIDPKLVGASVVLINVGVHDVTVHSTQPNLVNAAATTPVAAGDRVCLQITGRNDWLTAFGSSGRSLITVSAALTGDTAIGATFAAVTGLSVTITTTLPNEPIVVAFAGHTTKGANTGTVFATTFVDGANVDHAANGASLASLTAGFGANLSYTRIYEVPTAGSHTVEIAAKRDSNGANMNNGSRITVLQLR